VRTQELSLEVVDEISPADWSALDDRIYEFNVEATGVDDGRLLGIRLHDDAGELLAGLQGWTWAGWLEVRTLWVRADHRRHGLGRRLLAAAEAEARARGATRALLDTHGFQAPGFYEKLGYRRVAEIPDYPLGGSKVILVKELA
jgi:ribosomal protein S18 acetylase RimI-like enzyme